MFQGFFLKKIKINKNQKDFLKFVSNGFNWYGINILSFFFIFFLHPLEPEKDKKGKKDKGDKKE